MKSKKLIILTVVILAGAVAVIGSKSKLGHGDGAGHEGHDHSATEVYKADVEIDATDGHEGHDHGDSSGNEDHGPQERVSESVVPLVVQLSVADAKRFGIEVGSAGAGEFDVHVTVPGEITFNANKLAHIVPTVPGIVRQVVKDIGDNVAAGEIIAWIESTEVGGAKLDYLAKHLELSCCAIELVRIQEINDNTLKLLEALKDSPSLETLLKMNGSAMGMNRSRLVSSYAEFIFAKETYLREKDLYEKKITSKEDFLKAQLAFKKTDAEYTATKDSIAFEIKRDLLEAKRTQQTRELEVQAAERLLYLHGLTAKDVKNLVFMAKNQNFQAKAEEEECTDPNCKECVAATKDKKATFADNSIVNEKIAWYPVRSPFQGTVISKHITLGDVVSNNKAVFVVADLSSVWVDLQVHQKDIDLIRKGQKVTISTKSSVPETKGVIDYVDPVIDRKTRISLARVVLDNTSRRLRPGTFVTAKIMVENRNAKLMISKDILQDVDDTTCVFVQNSHGFEARPVTVGWSNKSKVEIVSGLKAGEKIVIKNSFRLKAELEKAIGGGHAGHGHAH